MTPRGTVLGLSLEQIAARARQLGAPDFTDGFYLLHDHNGGKDPLADDPFDRWSKPDSTFINRTADCIGGAAWCGGFDRWQPFRFPLYDGWINTDSVWSDATHAAKCFVQLPAPVPGCFVVARTGAPGFETRGHIGTVYAAPPAEIWEIDNTDLWRHVLITDVASRGDQRANTSHDATWWFQARHHGAAFVRSIMVP